MVLLFTDGKHEHFKQLEGEYCVVAFDEDGRLYFRALRSEKYIKLKKSGDLIHLGEYLILKDEDSIFVFKRNE